MRAILFLIFLSIANVTYSQWTTLDIPESLRYEDLFFLNDTLGWTVELGGNIYKTTDGGKSWDLQFHAPDYLRSIEFLTPDIGFAGSLDSTFYKTTDGGQTWTEISDQIWPDMPGICGLSSPASNVIYGVGIWASPAYVIKSTDSGENWTVIDLSSLANALVDVHFISPDTGFVSGMANPSTDGGIILYTTDGGDSWTVKHKTETSFDYIWKMQSPDGKHYFGSVEALPATGNVRMVRSNNGGTTWETDTIIEAYNYIQTIGFIDSLTGWTGGSGGFFETRDGGVTWDTVTLGYHYNRFQRLNDTTAVMTGFKIYKFTRENTTSIKELPAESEFHNLNVSPNPTSDLLEIEMVLNRRSNCKLELYTAEGKLIRSIFHHPLNQGTKHFTISLKDIPPQILYLTLKTNESLTYRKIVKE